jgi:hypothetical protein
VGAKDNLIPRPDASCHHTYLERIRGIAYTDRVLRPSERGKVFLKLQQVLLHDEGATPADFPKYRRKGFPLRLEHMRIIEKRH